MMWNHSIVTVIIIVIKFIIMIKIIIKQTKIHPFDFSLQNSFLSEIENNIVFYSNLC